MEDEPILLFGQQIKILVIIVAGFSSSALHYFGHLFAFSLLGRKWLPEALLDLYQGLSGLAFRGSEDTVLSIGVGSAC